MFSALADLVPPPKGGPHALGGPHMSLRGPRGPRGPYIFLMLQNGFQEERGPSRPCPLEATFQKYKPFKEERGPPALVP